MNPHRVYISQQRWIWTYLRELLLELLVSHLFDVFLPVVAEPRQHETYKPNSARQQRAQLGVALRVAATVRVCAGVCVRAYACARARVYEGSVSDTRSDFANGKRTCAYQRH